jgi:hypothetical protein
MIAPPPIRFTGNYINMIDAAADPLHRKLH